MSLKRWLFGTVAGLLACLPLSARATTFDINWTGSAGYTLYGSFSYASNLTGVITAANVTSFAIFGYHNGVLVGSWDPAVNGLHNSAIFNLNFDTATDRFLIGGVSSGPFGESWDKLSSGSCAGTAFGFASGSVSQSLCVNGAAVGAISTANSTLTAPEPMTIGLFGLGLTALAAVRRRTA